MAKPAREPITMAICGHCGAQIRDDVWVCGSCGQPVATARASGTTATDSYSSTRAPHAAPTPAYGSSAPAFAGQAEPVPMSRRRQRQVATRLIKSLIVLGILAGIAYAAVWFFVLRGGDPTPYLGTWRAWEPNTSQAMLFEITRRGDGAELSIGDSQMTAGPFTMSVESDHLSTSFETSDDASGLQKFFADAFRAYFEANGGKITLIFRRGTDANTLLVSYEGALRDGDTEADRTQAIYRVE